MSYDGKIMRRAMAALEADKQRRAAEYDHRRTETFLRCPRLEEIERKLRSTMSRLIAEALQQGSDPLPAVTRLKEENLELQRERGELLRQMGYPADYLEEKPACPHCGDTGYLRSSVCGCLKGYYDQAQCAELSKLLDLGGQSFENFSFDWYSDQPDPQLGISPREVMYAAFDTCSEFARSFGKRGGNLLLSGSTGLGKTFLSAAIARVVSQSGHSVVYDTAEHIFRRMEEEKFRRSDDESAAEDVRRYLDCDLLIIDDLGTEMVTSFIHSALYQLVNGRLLSGKSTVISTNFRPDALAERYTPQIASRINGEYTVVIFSGTDIRAQRAGM